MFQSAHSICCVCGVWPRLPTDQGCCRSGLWVCGLVVALGGFYHLGSLCTTDSCPPHSPWHQLSSVSFIIWDVNAFRLFPKVWMCRAGLLLLIILHIFTYIYMYVCMYIFVNDISFFPPPPRAINVCLTCAEAAARKEHSKRQQTVQVRTAVFLSLGVIEQMPYLTQWAVSVKICT